MSVIRRIESGTTTVKDAWLVKVLLIASFIGGLAVAFFILTT